MSMSASGQIELIKKMLALYISSNDAVSGNMEAAKWLMCYCYVYAAVFFLISEKNENFALGVLDKVSDAGSVPAYAHFKSSIPADDFKDQLDLFSKKSGRHA